MSGFGSLGGLGGRPGGFGMSYPTRVGAPNSQAIDYVRPREEWEPDFDARWKAEAARASGPSMSWVTPQQSQPDAPTGAVNWRDSTGVSNSWGDGIEPNSYIQQNRHLYSADAPIPVIGQTMTVGANPNYNPSAPYPTWGPTFETNGYQGVLPPYEAPKPYQVFNPGYTPDFSALEREKEKMMGLYDAQARQQQAYDVMSGGHQINGIMGPNYSDPNFGRITGAEPKTNAPEDMAWADGLYNPTGTYSTAPGKSTAWSLW